MNKQKNAKKPAARKPAAGKKKTINPQRQTAVKPTKKSGKPAEQKVKTTEKENFPHFRKHNTSNHPALITGEYSEKEYDYRKVMHGEKDGRHRNEKVSPNPNPKDPRPMYIGKRVRHDEKKNFSTWKYPWKYPSTKNKKKTVTSE